MQKINFASDNYAGVHPVILQSLNSANSGPSEAYGEDKWTEKAVEKFREYFGPSIEAYGVLTGTAANVLGMAAFLPQYGAVITAESAHCNTDECGAFERYTGCKILPVATPTGKLTPALVKPYLEQKGNIHRVQPLIISVTQPTELGILYSVEELKTLTDYAHSQGLKVHMDGARLCNAAAALNLPLRALTADCGIDVLSFGGTKNGMLNGEAVIFFTPPCAQFSFIRKQGMQLSSKMRFLSAQFVALLSHDLWLHNATHANEMAQLLKAHLESVEEITFAQQLFTNALFARVAHESIIEKLQEYYAFYVWDRSTLEVRWMTSFATTEKEVLEFAKAVKAACSFYHNSY